MEVKDYEKILYYDIWKNETKQKEIITSLQMLHESKHNIQIYLNELHIDVFIPISRKARVRGQLEHTNEVLVSIGCSYFVKMTIASCNKYLSRRILVFEDFLSKLRCERSFLQQRQDFSFPVEDNSFEITEKYDEETEKIWKIQHKKNIQKCLMEERILRQSDTVNYFKILDELEKNEEHEALTFKHDHHLISNIQKHTRRKEIKMNENINPNQDVIDFLDALDISELMIDIMETVVHKVSKQG